MAQPDQGDRGAAIFQPNQGLPNIFGINSDVHLNEQLYTSSLSTFIPATFDAEEEKSAGLPYASAVQRTLGGFNELSSFHENELRAHFLNVSDLVEESRNPDPNETDSTVLDQKPSQLELEVHDLDRKPSPLQVKEIDQNLIDEIPTAAFLCEFLHAEDEEPHQLLETEFLASNINLYFDESHQTN